MLLSLLAVKNTSFNGIRVQWRIYDFSKEGARCWGGWAPFPEKKSFLSLKWWVLVHLDAVFNQQKTWIVTIEALRHGFFGSIAKRNSKKVQKLSQKNSRSDQKGGAVAQSQLPPPWIHHCLCCVRVNILYFVMKYTECISRQTMV